MRPVVFLLYFMVFCLFATNVQAQKSLQARKTTIAPVVDGIVDSIYLALSDSASGFTQIEPNQGEPSSEKTIVYLIYDDEAIYVLFKCYQDPSGIVARIISRDNLSDSDDVISMTLDAFHDQQNGLGFWLNPLGTQCDFKITDDGKNTDVNWDTEWTSATVITEWGWMAEFAIPFSSIKYRKKLTDWGINFGRVIRYNSETTWWTESMTENFRISQGGVLTDITLPKSRKVLVLFPYATLRYEDSDVTGVDGEFKGDAGADLRWAVTPSLTANLTYNPDFATVEADQEQVNLTRYELSYPEKRLFFQEGNEMFNTRINTFYSRRIGDIQYGAKLSGKAGGYNVNVLNARRVDVPELDEPAAFYTAARVKKDVLKSSFVGLTFADKSWDGGYSRSLSADYTLNLGNTWYLTGQFVGSAPGDLKTSSAYFLRFARENNIYHYHLRYSNIGENFQENVNQTGFIVDDDRHELDGDITYKWWIRNNAINYIRFATFNNIFWNHKGVLRSWYLTSLVNLYLHNRFSFEVLYNNEFKLFEKKYYNHKYGFEVGYNTDEWSSAKMNYLWGINFDRTFSLWQLNARTKLTDKLSVEYAFDKLDFTPDTTNSSTFINVLSFYYNFTKDLWIKVFAQNNTSYDKIYVYGLFGWRFKPPFGAVYFIYTHDELSALTQPGRLNSDIVYLKVTYPIVIK